MYELLAEDWNLSHRIKDMYRLACRWIRNTYLNRRYHISIAMDSFIDKEERLDVVSKDAYITIGPECYIGKHFSILAGADVTLGKNVLIASDVMISSENHSIDPESEIPYMGQPLVSKEVRVDDNCWIGEKVCILPGVHIGKGSVIGASAVVTKSCEPYSILVGNPARVIKRYNFTTHKWERCSE